MSMVFGPMRATMQPESRKRWIRASTKSGSLRCTAVTAADAPPELPQWGRTSHSDHNRAHVKASRPWQGPQLRITDEFAKLSRSVHGPLENR